MYFDCFKNNKKIIMEERKKVKHESFGMISISKFSCNGAEYFGSDLVHNNGVSVIIQRAEKEVSLSSDWYFGSNDLIRVEMTSNQFVDAITSGMNTSGVPCTIKHFNGKRIEQTQHVEDKKERFSNNMEETHLEYHKRIDEIIELLSGNVGKRKKDEIIHELGVLKSHIKSNTNYVMTKFNESMDKSVTEAKHSISNYINQKVKTLGIEALRDEMTISIDNNGDDSKKIS